MSNTQPDAHLKRRREVTPADIKQMSLQLAEMSAALDASSVAMTHMGIKSVVVDGIMKYDRSRELLNEFDANLMQAVRRARPLGLAGGKKATTKKAAVRDSGHRGGNG